MLIKFPHPTEPTMYLLLGDEQAISEVLWELQQADAVPTDLQIQPLITFAGVLWLVKLPD